MSKDKYPSIFSPQMEAIVFIILQIFFATRAVLKIALIIGCRNLFKCLVCGFPSICSLFQSEAFSQRNSVWIAPMVMVLKLLIFTVKHSNQNIG